MTSHADDGLIAVGAEQLDEMAAQLRATHGSMTGGFEVLSGDLLRTMADWGEGTASRAAYDAFKRSVDTTFDEMFVAVQAMPALVAGAATEARAGESRRAGMWQR